MTEGKGRDGDVRLDSKGVVGGGSLGERMLYSLKRLMLRSRWNVCGNDEEVVQTALVAPPRP